MKKLSCLPLKRDVSGRQASEPIRRITFASAAPVETTAQLPSLLKRRVKAPVGKLIGVSGDTIRRLTGMFSRSAKSDRASRNAPADIEIPAGAEHPPSDSWSTRNDVSGNVLQRDPFSAVAQEPEPQLPAWTVRPPHMRQAPAPFRLKDSDEPPLLPARSLISFYERHKLPIGPHTEPRFFDDDVIGQPREFTSGGCNTVYALQLNRKDGTSFKGVFKPFLPFDNTSKAQRVGIPSDDPQPVMRNFAAMAYGKLLGTDLIAQTELGFIEVSHLGPRLALQLANEPDHEGPELGMVMEFAPGTIARHLEPEIFDSPIVRRELTWLQLLDQLTGEADRHCSNYFVDIKRGVDGSIAEAKITGIDNDLSFGQLIDRADGAWWSYDSDEEVAATTHLPAVLDTDMVRRVENITAENLRALLGNSGSAGNLGDTHRSGALLGDAEISAAIARLEHMKAHIATLREQGRIIEPDQWDQPEVANALSRDNSYAVRDRAEAAR